ncbi:MAG: DUF1203 domain-containing protein [Oleispira sp.]|nr:DUF1203 domain-containing protein [Oleispira sp.]MBL4879856.1 DUF1203 domain-containing protein [Oleispira sp.]
MLRKGGTDAYNDIPQVRIAEGLSNPCRHCLQLIGEGEKKLVLAYMPFDTKQPYAETGPIFLHQQECGHYNSDIFPPWFMFLEPAIIRGYDDENWIVYETGAVISGSDIEKKCMTIFQNKDVEFVHIRSKYNCFQCKVERA